MCIRDRSETVRPQDNFYEYVKSEKLKDKVQDEDSQGWDHFADMESKIEEDLMKISDDLKNKREELSLIHILWLRYTTLTNK